jgi:hypothetical protein
MGNTRQELPTFIEFAVDTIGNDIERPDSRGRILPFFASEWVLHRTLLAPL